MKVTLTSTEKIVTIRHNFTDIPARIWEGVTETGIACHAYITRIAVDKYADATQFEAELKECEPPSPEVEAIPMRLIL